MTDRRVLSPKKASKPPGIARRQRRANELELQSIENLLGEDFESLAQAKRALARESKAATKKVVQKQRKTADQSKVQIKATNKRIKTLTKSNAQEIARIRRQARSLEKQLQKTRESLGAMLLKATTEKKQKRAAREAKSKRPLKTESNRPYTLREMSVQARQSVQSLLNDHDQSVQLDKVLRPGQWFVAEIPYRYVGADGRVHTGYSKTYKVYDNAFSLFDTLTGYGQESRSELSQTRFLNNIKILEFDGTPADWKKIKDTERRDRRSFFVDVHKKLGDYNPKRKVKRRK